ncbi:hypothetical protein AXA84_0257 [Candidatus Phytoplasma oryzae]|uniref:Transmembrane protein n=1 Tax=Candidatus Phytoplasma oryzae TaxID=203274 RepID=A0A139JQL0_9MOLU|nr:hypothetical protein [Candidatus Phytoplasma oryzae]KXT29228.1 hypothetical protein AXA84_0257 [Candidatus Phytoplasma oryzae]RAM57701.1 hypothetical protein DH96_02030 [Candidatus Phytoplasma oryzae]
MNLEQFLAIVIFSLGLTILVSIPLYFLVNFIQLLINLNCYLKSKHQLNQLQIIQQKQKQIRRKKIKDADQENEDQFKTE